MTTEATPTAVGSNDELGRERAAFEAWCVLRWRGDRNALGRNGDEHPRNPGEYNLGNVEFAWQAWQAARPRPVTDERLAELVLQTVYEGDASTPHRDAWAAEIGIPFARAIERELGIKA